MFSRMPMILSTVIIIAAGTFAASETACIHAAETTAVQNSAKPADPSKEYELIINQRQELRAKEAELRLLEKKLDEKLRMIEGMQSNIKQEMQIINRVSDTRVKRLIKIYSAMDAKSAARLMEDLDTDQAVDVLAGMRGEASGAILANMERSRAAQLIKLIAAYKGPKSVFR